MTTLARTIWPLIKGVDAVHLRESFLEPSAGNMFLLLQGAMASVTRAWSQSMLQLGPLFFWKQRAGIFLEAPLLRSTVAHLRRTRRRGASALSPSELLRFRVPSTRLQGGPFALGLYCQPWCLRAAQDFIKVRLGFSLASYKRCRLHKAVHLFLFSSPCRKGKGVWS